MRDDEDDEENLFDLYHSSGNARDQVPVERQAPEEDDELSNSGIDLSDMEVHDLLVMGRRMLLQDLLKAVAMGYASPQEKAILAKLLKDNGMVLGDPMDPNRPAQPQRAPLPTFGKPDYEP